MNGSQNLDKKAVLMRNKFMMSALILMSVSTAQSAVIPTEITLTHRILESSKCGNDSCYFDFYNMTQNYGYGLSLEFGNDWGENKFSGVQVVHEVARIADLGVGSCKNIPNMYEAMGEGYPTKADRTTQPMFWLSYSDAWGQLQNGQSGDSVPAQADHCYLMYKSSSDQRIIVAFHVKSLVKDTSVTIDEIEVFQRAKIEEVK
jgi:hypothetical protein